MMKRLIPLLVLCAIALGTVQAFADVVPGIVVKQAKWATWLSTTSSSAPRGILESSLSDTSALYNGADDVDTTAAIYIGDYAFGHTGLTVGPGAFTAMNGLKVFLTSDGLSDDVDSLYYMIEHSPDGIHWAGTGTSDFTGVLAGIDQGQGTEGLTVKGCLSFFIKLDQDIADGTTAVGAPVHWAWSPYIRLRILTDDTAGNKFYAARLFVAYPGFKNIPQ